MSLDHYIELFRKLNVNRRGGHASPHKPGMLLAVIGLAEVGLLKENKIYFSDGLIDRYQEIFKCVQKQSDHLNPYFPFFHFNKEKFWHLFPLKGRDASLAAMHSTRSYRDIRDNIEYAFIDDDLHQLLQDSNARKILRDELVAFWFGEHEHALQLIFQQDAYEKKLRSKSGEEIREAAQQYEKPVRDAAFRRVVTEVYDYRCAASGHRLIMPDGKFWFKRRISFLSPRRMTMTPGMALH